MSVTIRDNRDEQRFEALVDDQVAGFSEYRLREDRITFTHTEVDDRFEGHGVGSTLARGALDDVRARGERKVVALCPFIAAWLARHPGYQDLVAP